MRPVRSDIANGSTMFIGFMLVGIYWLAASFWVTMGGDPAVVWASILPTVWLGSFYLYKE